MTSRLATTPRIPDRRVVGWLSLTDSAAYLGLHRNTFARYWREHPDLVMARRTLSNGSARWHVRDLDKHLERHAR